MEHFVSSNQSLVTARELCSKGNADLATAYFYFAGHSLADKGMYIHAAKIFVESAQYSEIDEFYARAAEDYETAATLYSRAGSPEFSDELLAHTATLRKRAHLV